MKRIFATAFFALVFFGLSLNTAQAASLTSEQIQAIINLVRSFGASESVMRNVEDSLYGRVSSGNEGAVSAQSAAFCHVFTRDLSVGSAGADVRALNEVLSRENIADRVAYDLSSFDEKTASHVVTLQQRHGVYPASGYVGPRTRAMLNSIYGCQSTTFSSPVLPSLSVSQSAISFIATQGDTHYQQKSISVTNTGLAQVSFRITVPNQPSWLNTAYNRDVLIAYPMNPVGIGTSLDTRGLEAGTYSANIILTGGFSGSPITIPIAATILPKAAREKPDLFITGVDCTPSAPKVDEWITCTVTVYNNSNVAVTAPFKVNVQGTAGIIYGVPARQYRSVTVPAAFSFSTSGTKELHFPMDIENVIDESNEANNNVVKTLTIAAASGKPRLCATYGDLNLDGTISQGDAELLRVHVLGTVLLDARRQLDADLNNDGNISTLDVAYLNGYLGGTQTTFPVCGSVTARRDAIAGYYRDLLWREPDTAGLDYWDKGGLPLTAVYSGIINSYEYTMKKQIRSLYEELLGRDADKAGLAYWYSKIYENNWSISMVRDGILSSDEYRQNKAKSTPIVTVFSPKGGESLASNQVIDVKWSATASLSAPYLYVLNASGSQLYSRPLTVGTSGVERVDLASIKSVGSVWVKVCDQATDRLPPVCGASELFTVALPVPVGKPLVCGTYGDFNGDNRISDADSTILRNHILGTQTLSPRFLAVADVNADGNVSTLDMASLSSYLAGNRTSFVSCFVSTERQKQIANLYYTLLRREPDEAGLKYWDNTGFTIDTVSSSIRASAEYKALPR